ncbi:unnamed protein product, partial [Mesorhabditis spiculigera]
MAFCLVKSTAKKPELPTIDEVSESEESSLLAYRRYSGGMLNLSNLDDSSSIGSEYQYSPSIIRKPNRMTWDQVTESIRSRRRPSFFIPNNTPTNYSFERWLEETKEHHEKVNFEWDVVALGSDVFKDDFDREKEAVPPVLFELPPMPEAAEKQVKRGKKKEKRERKRAEKKAKKRAIKAARSKGWFHGLVATVRSWF